MQEIVNNIFSDQFTDFEATALHVFRYQYQHNLLYKKWVNMLDCDVNSVQHINEIPFLPVSFFKAEEVTTGKFEAEIVFTSSGTTSSEQSRHYVKNVALYEESFTKGFKHFYGDIKEWCIIGLLPSYLERQGSSLVFMADKLIQLSAHPDSGFYLYNYEELAKLLQHLEHSKQKTMVLGVTFALLDFATAFPMQLNHTTIVETGGMKGRKIEMIRAEIHEILCRQWGISHVHSEYGMTELLSQAYSTGQGIYKAPPWMKILVRQEDDPLAVSKTGRGIINIIDLANIDSCSFIATDDAGILHPNNTFEVIGRIDNSDIRGCSQLML